MRQRRLLAVALTAVLLSALPVTGADAASVNATCSKPESDADALLILNDVIPQPNSYWYDHTDLTAAIAPHPSIAPERLAAIESAVSTWERLRDCLAGAVSLTYLGTTARAQQQADIVIRYVPHVGGNSFAGMAQCSPQSCNNVLVSSQAPAGTGIPPDTAELTFQLTMHELGHALGLGHATNPSTDLMGTTWFTLAEPVISDCDMDALAYVWSWAINGTKPAPPGPYDCAQS